MPGMLVSRRSSTLRAMPRGVSTVARPRASCRLWGGGWGACGRLVARRREQDVDRDIAAGIEIDGGDMAPVMGDLGDPAIDDRYVAARKIGLDIGRNVMTVGEERQPVVDG